MCKICTGTRGKGVVTGSPTYLFNKGISFAKFKFDLCLWSRLSNYLYCDVIGSFYASDGGGCWVFLPELQQQSTSRRSELTGMLSESLVTFRMNSTKHTFTDIPNIGHPN